MLFTHIMNTYPGSTMLPHHCGHLKGLCIILIFSCILNEIISSSLALPTVSNITTITTTTKSSSAKANSTQKISSKQTSSTLTTRSPELSINLCSPFNKVTVTAAVMRSAAPALALHNNLTNFTKDLPARSIEACAASCCSLPKCDVAYFHNLTCYHISCDSNGTATGSCNAVTLMDTHVNYSMVRVRDIHTQHTHKMNNTIVSQRSTTLRLLQATTSHRTTVSTKPTTVLTTKTTAKSTPSKSTSKQVKPNLSLLKANVTVVTTKSSTKATTPKSSSSPTTTQPQITRLTVSVGDNKTLTLPKNEMVLSAFVVPSSTGGKEYKYQWTLLTSPPGDPAVMEGGMSSSRLVLKHLIAGKYVFRVTVTDKNATGEAVVAVDVLPPKRKNQAPLAKITPAYQEVQLPNNLVLDGSTSTDDDKIVNYHWEEVSGPLTGQTKLDDKPMLQMPNLMPGFYIFKLTVIDSDGASNSTTANVSVLKEKDYPPIAKPGQNVILYLPQNSVTLYGNASTDDHQIISYEWIKEGSDNLAADMQGARTSILQVSNMEIGVYTFTLKVTDSSKQSHSASVKVFVKARQNSAPKADAGPSVTVNMPVDRVTLFGNGSSDDDSIVKYLWSQISGPQQLTAVNGVDKPILVLSNLRLGHYVFQVIVNDKEGLNSTATTTLDILESSNQKPRAEAGPDREITLPDNFVALDGRKSWDDKEIVRFRWVRSDDSPAAGEILNNSYNHPVLLVGNLISGIYTFRLTVVDAEDAKSTDSVKVTVNEDPTATSLVELHLDANIKTFTEENKKNVASQLGFLIHKYVTGGSIEVHVSSVREHIGEGNVVLTFYVTKKSATSAAVSLVNGKTLEKLLRQKLGPQKDVIDYPMMRVESAICQNNCSNHGHCDPRTKLCICDAYWITNQLRIVYGDGQSNCDWSLVYVIIIVFLVAVVFSLALWFLICCSRRHLDGNQDLYYYSSAQRRNVRMKRIRTPLSSKKHKYSLLEGFDEVGSVQYTDKATHFQGKGSNGHSVRQSLLASHSETDSDEEETIFINRKLQGETASNSIAHRKGNNGSAVLET